MTSQSLPIEYSERWERDRTLLLTDEELDSFCTFETPGGNLTQLQVRVKLFSSLQRHVDNYDSDKGVLVTLPAGATVKDLIDSLKLPQREARLISVRNLMRQQDFNLADGDLVQIFPPLAGG